MAPDLNSLPPSQSPISVSPIQARPSVIMAPPSEAISVHTPPSPHSPLLSSLQAAATINSGFRNSPDHSSPRFERRRSSLMMNMHLTDPNLPGPGEMAQHHRAPSLGEIHQQLENEQEAQVVSLPCRYVSSLHIVTTVWRYALSPWQAPCMTSHSPQKTDRSVTESPASHDQKPARPNHIPSICQPLVAF